MCQNPSTCGQRDHAVGACACGGRGHAFGEFHLRPASLADLPAVHAMIRELAAFEHLDHALDATRELLEKHLFGPAPAARAIIAHADGAAAGFAVWYATYSTFIGRRGGFVEDLYVRPPFRRRGLGRRLLATCAHQAESAGCARLEWRALKWNDTALAFYKSLGAAPLSEWLTLRLDEPAFARLAAEKNATTAPLG